MHIKAETLDDLLYKVFKKLLLSKMHIQPSRGAATELVGVLLHITRPRARLSRTEMKGKLFSCLGELLWYLAGSNSLKFIEHYIPGYRKYSDDGRTIYGGYGPRFFKKNGINQVANIISLLKKNPFSRKAVIQLFDAIDITQKHKDVPCTCTLQFLVRGKRRKVLHMLTTMRSNDAFLGLPHDVFAFTMIQEIVARSLQIEIGTYKHVVGSLHLYERDAESARQYLEEGIQEKIEMPKMSGSDPWKFLSIVKKVESSIRTGKPVDINASALDTYWKDVVSLLKIYAYTKDKDVKKASRNKREVEKIRVSMHSSVYDSYIEQRKLVAEARATPANEPSQIPLF